MNGSPTVRHAKHLLPATLLRRVVPLWRVRRRRNIRQLPLLGVGTRALRIFWRAAGSLTPPPFADDGGKHPDQPNNRSDNRIHNHPGLGTHTHLVGELEPKPTVDDAKRDYATAEPEMAVGPEGARAVLLEERVVQEAEDGLEEEADEDDDADDGVLVGELSSVSEALFDIVPINIPHYSRWQYTRRDRMPRHRQGMRKPGMRRAARRRQRRRRGEWQWRRRGRR